MSGRESRRDRWMIDRQIDFMYIYMYTYVYAYKHAHIHIYIGILD